MEYLIPLLTAIISALVAWKTKGRFEKRVLNASTHSAEFDSYSEMAEKMQSRFALMQVNRMNLSYELSGLKIENQTLRQVNAELREQNTALNSENYLLKQELKGSTKKWKDG